MKRLGRLLIAGAALALAGIGALVMHAPAKAESSVSGCIQTTDPTNYGTHCVPSWTPLILNGLTTTATPVHQSGVTYLGTLYCYNANASVAYIQLFDVALSKSVNLGTTVPKLSFGIPTGLASGIGPGSIGIVFYNGLQAAVTTTATGSSATSVGMDCNVTYD